MEQKKEMDFPVLRPWLILQTWRYIEHSFDILCTYLMHVVGNFDQSELLLHFSVLNKIFYHAEILTCKF